MEAWENDERNSMAAPPPRSRELAHSRAGNRPTPCDRHKGTSQGMIRKMKQTTRRPLLALIVAVMAAAASLLMQTPAVAMCPASVSFKKSLRQASAVWWVAVTDASVSQGLQPGEWTLRVDVLDVLKGSRPPAGSNIGTVFVSTCGPMLSQKQLQDGVTSFRGSEHLFIGDIRSGYFFQSSSPFVFSPGRISQQELYAEALKDLGLHHPPVGVARDFGPTNGWLWWLLGATALVALVGVVLFFIVTRRRAAA